VHLLPPASMSLVREQRLQSIALAAALEQDRLPMIVAGDFNATGASEHLRYIRADRLHSTHDEAGTGRGGTWPRRGVLRHAPSIRLDHVLCSHELVATRSAVGDDFGSDHKPVWAVIDWK
jgi:endonuclease/exonuclease/phosphatase (EEP) superfamily protein YafD